MIGRGAANAGGERQDSIQVQGFPDDERAPHLRVKFMVNSRSPLASVSSRPRRAGLLAPSIRQQLSTCSSHSSSAHVLMSTVRRVDRAREPPIK